MERRGSSPHFPRLTLRGDAATRGKQHGVSLRESICTALDFYWRHFFSACPMSPDEIRGFAESVREEIDSFRPEYRIELEAIASGAGVDPWQIFALSARTEIINFGPPECTALFFEEKRILGQNWDWFRPFEEWMVVFEVEKPDGRRFATLSEPGMLAKIGMNDGGLGLCLNILSWPSRRPCVPTHVLTRAILDAHDLEEVEDIVVGAIAGQSSNLLIANAEGQGVCLELGQGACHRIVSDGGAIVHTNHYLADAALDRYAHVPNTEERLSTARRKVRGAKKLDLATMRDVLLDRDGEGTSICCKYEPQAAYGGLELGTCATLIMDLAARELLLKKGPHRNAGFEAVSLASAARRDGRDAPLEAAGTGSG